MCEPKNQPLTRTIRCLLKGHFEKCLYPRSNIFFIINQCTHSKVKNRQKNHICLQKKFCKCLFFFWKNGGVGKILEIKEDFLCIIEPSDIKVDEARKSTSVIRQLDDVYFTIKKACHITTSLKGNLKEFKSRFCTKYQLKIFSLISSFSYTL